MNSGLTGSDPALWLLWQNQGLMAVALGLTWWSGRGMSATWQRAVLGMVVFNALAGLSALLLWAAGRFQMAVVPAGLLVGLGQGLGLASCWAVWRVGRLVLGWPPAPWRAGDSARAATLVLSSVALLAVWPGGAQQAASLTQLALGATWALIGWGLWRRLQGLGRAAGHGLLLGLGGLALLVLGADAARLWLAPTVAGVGLPGQATTGGGWRLLGPGARGALVLVANLLVAYQVFVRALHAVQQVSSPEPLAGVLAADTVHKSLLSEAALHAAQGRSLAVVAVHVPEMAALRAEWGTATAQAVLAELSLLVRLRLQPTDLLGLADADTLLLCLVRTTELMATARVQALVQAAQAETGLHPAGGSGLRLQTGLCMLAPGEDPAPLLVQACQAARGTLGPTA